MGTANEQIRITEQVKRELDRRRREDESSNHVSERIVGEDERDLLAGFGAFDGTDRGDTMREVRNRGDEKFSRQIDAMAESRSDE